MKQENIKKQLHINLSHKNIRVKIKNTANKINNIMETTEE